MRVAFAALLLTLATGCSTPSRDTSALPVMTGAAELVPEPVEGEQLRLDTIARLSNLAKTESLLVAQYERDQLSLKDAGASTLIAIDSRLAWLSGDVTLADQLLQKLKDGNTAAIDFALEEQAAQAALSGQWLRAAALLFEKAQTPAEQGNASPTVIAYLATSSEQHRANWHSSSERLGIPTGEPGWKCNWLTDRDPLRCESGKVLPGTDRRPPPLQPISWPG